MITVYTGCMFAGKTTKLLEKYKEFNRQNSLIVQWSKDTRHSKVQTHDGKYIDYATTIRLNDINDLFDEKYKKYKNIFIDDAQFFIGIYDCMKKLKSQKENIFISGLDTDYQQKPFVEILDLKNIADNFIYIKGICKVDSCQNISEYTIRTIDMNDRILIGDNVYKPVCKSHINYKF